MSRDGPVLPSLFQPGAQRCTEPRVTSPVLVTPGTVCHLLRWGICPENRKMLGWNSAGCHLQELTENLELMYSGKMLRLMLGTAVCYSYRYARDKCGFYHFGYVKRKTKQVLSAPVALYVPELCSLWCDIRCYFIFETKQLHVAVAWENWGFFML